MRVVLDTNIFISSMIAPHGTSASIVRRAFERDFELVSSEHIFQELTRTLGDPDIERRIKLSREERDEHVARIVRTAVSVDPDPATVGVASDPGDDAVIGTAITGQATYLVTGDIALRNIGTHEGVTIIAPAEFMTALEGSGA